MLASRLKREREVKQMKYSKQQKSHHIRAWQQSGLTKAAYCGQHNIPFSTFKNWHSRYISQSSASFIPIVVTDETRADDSIAIHLPSGIRVNIPVMQLTHVLKALC